jgi:hypothetical protein
MVVTAHKRAVGVFSNPEEAKEALNELKASGFAMDNVSLIAKQVEQNQELAGAKMSDRIGEQDVDTPTAVIANVATGTFWGTILVGLSSLAIPGVGPVLAAGSLGVALVSATAGLGLGTAAANGLVKALSDLGIPEEQARIYSDRLIGNASLVIVEGTEDEINRAKPILSDRGIQDWGVYDSPEGTDTQSA